jgi:beta-fructofuranosidase
VTLRLRDRWVWDFWIADSGTEFHAFFLQAPRSLIEPDLRHAHATVGHAVSIDLVEWDVLPDALLPGPPGAWDDRAIWTGSVVESGGLWHLFYTGTSLAEDGSIQRVGLAVSQDLHEWSRHPDNPIIESDARWYEQLDPTVWPHLAWRDPWIFPDETGNGWHALITARGTSGPGNRRGVLGSARSADLIHWTVEPPLASPGLFHHLEVPQVFRVRDRWYLIFSVDHPDGGVTYACPAGSPLGPFDVSNSFPLGGELDYSGRLITGRDGRPRFLAFLNTRSDGSFIGELGDPADVDIDSAGHLVLRRGTAVPERFDRQAMPGD